MTLDVKAVADGDDPVVAGEPVVVDGEPAAGGVEALPVGIGPVGEYAPALPTTAPRVFGAAKAFGAYFLLLLAQMLAGVAIILGTTIAAVIAGADANDPNLIVQLTSQATVPLLISAGVVSSVVIFFIAKLWAWHLVVDPSEAGIGIAPARRTHVVLAVCIGAVLAIGYLAVVLWLVPSRADGPLGPLASAAASGGLNRIAWALLALVYAPVAEEFFFRGLLFSGFRTSWGTGAAAVVVTLLFVVLHLPETISYWPASVAVIVLSCVTLAARITTRSLLPAVALHTAYNAVIVAAVYGMH